jgi:hypothetical protein
MSHCSIVSWMHGLAQLNLVASISGIEFPHGGMRRRAVQQMRGQAIQGAIVTPGKVLVLAQKCRLNPYKSPTLVSQSRVLADLNHPNGFERGTGALIRSWPRGPTPRQFGGRHFPMGDKNDTVRGQ